MLLVNSCQDDPYVEPAPGDGPLTPKSSAYITGIRLNSFPALDPMSLPWDTINDSIPPLDPNGLADPFFNLTDFNTSNPLVFWSQGTHFENVDLTDSVAYTLTTPYKAEPFNTNFKLNVYDFDLPDSVLMGYVTLFIGEYPDPDNPYPDAVLIEENGISVTVGLKWEE